MTTLVGSVSGEPVGLVSGTEPLEALDALVKTNEKDSWTTAATGLQITAGAIPAVPPVLEAAELQGDLDVVPTQVVSVA